MIFGTRCVLGCRGIRVSVCPESGVLVAHHDDLRDLDGISRHVDSDRIKAITLLGLDVEMH